MPRFFAHAVYYVLYRIG